MFKKNNKDDDLFLNDIGSLSQIYDKPSDRFKKPPAPKSSFWDHKKSLSSAKGLHADKPRGRFDDERPPYDARKGDKRPSRFEPETPRRFEPESPRRFEPETPRRFDADDDDYEPVIEDLLEDGDEDEVDDFEETPRLLASSVKNAAAAADMGDLPWRKAKTSSAVAEEEMYDFETPDEIAPVADDDRSSSLPEKARRAGDGFSIEKASFGKWFETEESKRAGATKTASTTGGAGDELLDENYPNEAAHYEGLFKHKPVKLSLESRPGGEDRSSQNGSAYGFKQRDLDDVPAAPPKTPRRAQLDDDDDVVIVNEANAASASRQSRFSDEPPAASPKEASSPFSTPASQPPPSQQHIPSLFAPADGGAGAEPPSAAPNVAHSPAPLDGGGAHFLVSQAPPPVANPQIVPPPVYQTTNFGGPPPLMRQLAPPPNFVSAYSNAVSVRVLLGKSNYLICVRL